MYSLTIATTHLYLFPNGFSLKKKLFTLKPPNQFHNKII